VRITRLRLTGFKSFVEPAELRIERGLTGVVGPNGCGKSNLLEAIRWVMGESSPKSMRGGGMDDVIFAGTETRPARDFAEVALVCDTEGAPLPGLIAENDSGALEVIRRIERGAGSAYRANGQDVRARDVGLIFADAATGAHSPALVSQGKVASIINAKPQERRQLLEEAAGIAGLHVRRKDAEQKLRQTETNLSRLADILADMDARANQLRRQARAAERYARLSETIRIAEGRMIYARWRDAAAASDAARTESQSADGAVESAQADHDACAVAQSAAMLAQTTARDQAVAEREAAHFHTARITEHRNDLAAITKQIADLEVEKKRIAQDRAAEDALASEGAAAIIRLEEAGREAVRQMAGRDRERPALEGRSILAADALRDAEIALAQARAEAANEDAARRIAESAHGEAQRRIARIAAEITRLEQDVQAIGDGDALAITLRTAQQQAEQSRAAIGQCEAAIASAGLARAAIVADRATIDTAVAQARADLAALTSEAKAIERTLTTSASHADHVINQLRAEPGFEAALAAALGDDASAPLLDDRTSGDARGWRGDAPAANDPALDASMEPLSAHVSAPPALARRLAQIGVVAQDDGQPLQVGQRLVTHDGAMRRWDGFVSHGDGAAAAERLERRNRHDALVRQIPEAQAALTQAESAHADWAAKAERAESALIAERARLTSAEEQARLARRAVDSAESALARHQASARHIAERRASADQEQAEAATALAATQAALSALPDGSATADHLAAQNQIAAQARVQLSTAREELASLDRDVSRYREAQIEAAADLRGWKARAGEAARRVTSMDARLATLATEHARISGKPATLSAALALCEEESRAMQARLAEAMAAEHSTTDALRSADHALERAREALANAREARAGAIARAENAEGRRIEMGRISGERFSCPPPLLPEKVGFDSTTVGSPADEGQAHERLQQERERIGPVNLIAAQELAEIEAEQTGSAEQAAELQQAVNRLRGSIGQLNREGRQRLSAAFEQVDGHFRRLFTALFGGGQAHLAMVDSDDPLEAGLEILAQPPGKKLATLTLLSGGEQALTAIALIFALFLTNPAPICVLDEVDAPLDDANVERFCDLLDQMVAETQTRYLIVTHNAVTMARMHRLFGVTMVERGVSRLVSVDLRAAEELAAAE
jgi:chromosome segregation protein